MRFSAKKFQELTGQKVKRTNAEIQRDHQLLLEAAMDYLDLLGVYYVQVDASRIRDYVGNIRPRSASAKGTPDLLIAFHPIAMLRWLDAKTGEEKPNEYQKDEWPRMLKLGVPGAMFGDIGTAIKLIDGWFLEARAIWDGYADRQRAIMELESITKGGDTDAGQETRSQKEQSRKKESSSQSSTSKDEVARLSD